MTVVRFALIARRAVLLLLAVGLLSPMKAAAQEPESESLQDPAANAPMAAGELRALWEGGIGFPEFLAAAEARKERWNNSYREGTVSGPNLARAQRVREEWKLLVVAADWCGDSAANLPYLARLVESMDNVELRILPPEAGERIMASHPTPDGRSATPTLLLLDEDYNESGCWIERPAPLQAWYQANKGVLERDALYGRVWSFYDSDRGDTALSEVLRLMESVEGGTVICGLR